jgi:hypothetical protein
VRHVQGHNVPRASRTGEIDMTDQALPHAAIADATAASSFDTALAASGPRRWLRRFDAR